MKLYATVQSEKAKKSQGGNKRLDISLLVGSKQEQISAGVVALKEVEKGKFVVIYIQNGETTNLTTIYSSEHTKGEKQKDKHVNEGECYMDVFNKKCLLTTHKH